jgi:hypothetical protein
MYAWNGHQRACAPCALERKQTVPKSAQHAKTSSKSCGCIKVVVFGKQPLVANIQILFVTQKRVLNNVGSWYK